MSLAVAVREEDEVDIITYLGIGAVAGLVMGLLGVGGGALIITALVLVAHLPQKLAQGTTLLVVAAPVSLLAAYKYYQQGNVDIRAGLWIMAAFLVFSYVGAIVAGKVPAHALRIGLGVALILMGAKMVMS